MRGLKLLIVLVPAILLGCSDRGLAGPGTDPTIPGAGVPGDEARAGAGSPTTVFTRNLYLGGDIAPPLGAQDPVAAATAIWNQIQHTNYPARAERLAAEIAELRPDLIGLQEAVRFTVGPFPSAEFPTTELVDFVTVLRLNLAALGHSYVVAACQPNTRVALPLPMGEGLVTIGYQDAVAILVREGVETADPVGQNFVAMPPTTHTAGIPFRRGWTQVDARVGGGWVRFVSTHLEIQAFAPVQVAQAAGLLASLESSPHPVILVGDFNSAANFRAPADRKTASYGMILAAGFHDLWTRTHSTDEGLTCCHASDLSNPSANFNQRLDLIFARNKPGSGGGFAGAAELTVVGEDEGERFAAPKGHGLWPSDHAGVGATLRLPPGLFAVR
ncbi:MAG: endonuclease/exonuclease/phosphatase family protein [Gemmatimonadota bacterium]